MVVYQVSCCLLGIAEHPSRFWGNVGGKGSEGSSAFDWVDSTQRNQCVQQPHQELHS